MEAYRCAYRDPHSPLTPLAPMDSNVFTFQVTPTHKEKSVSNRIGSAKRTKTSVAGSTYQSSYVASCKSPNFLVPTSSNIQRKSPVSQKMIYHRSEEKYENGRLVSDTKVTVVKHVYKADNVIGKYHLSPHTIRSIATSQSMRTPVKKYYIPPRSPVVQQPISPTMETILHNADLEKYVPLFAREEIDSDVFFTFTADDLINIGIKSEDDRDTLLRLICYS